MFIVEYILPFLVLFAILVAVHEWGHYYAARTLGIHATHFSLGMGPVLWSRTDRHGTVWQLAALPLGGYVRFLGDKDGSSAAPTKEMFAQAAGLSEQERRRYFHLRGPGDRAFVIFAGPAINLLLGLAIISALYVGIGRPVVEPVIRDVVAEMPAARAGVRPGDRVVSVNGNPVASFTDIHDEIALYPNGMVTLVVERQGSAGPARETLTMQAETHTIMAFGVKQTVGRIGIQSTEATLRTMGPLDALATGAVDVYKLTKGMLVALGQIITGARPLDDIGGPVKMAEMSGGAAKAGFSAFVFLVAAVSINLAVINLMPLPALDGGQLVVCAVEKAMRRPVSERALGYVHRVGVVALLGLMVVLTVNDVRNLITRLVG